MARKLSWHGNYYGNQNNLQKQGNLQGSLSKFFIGN